MEQLLSLEECIDFDEAHATRDRARQSWTNDGEVVSVPREVVAENQTQVLESSVYVQVRFSLPQSEVPSCIRREIERTVHN